MKKDKLRRRRRCLLCTLADSMDAVVHQSIRRSLWSAHAIADEQLSREITIPNTAGEIVREKENFSVLPNRSQFGEHQLEEIPSQPSTLRMATCGKEPVIIEHYKCIAHRRLDQNVG